MVKALDFIVKNDDSKNQYTKKLATDKKAMFTINYTSGANYFKPFHLAGNNLLTLNNTIPKTGEVFFNPEIGGITKSGKKFAPVIYLFHEF